MGLGPEEATADDGSSPAISMGFGDYELLEQIGRGGQGVVFRARQQSLNRIVALKVIGLGRWAAAAHVKRFRREAEAAARLEHPGIVPIYEVGERDGSCYFSMKFIEGGQLDEVVRRTPISTRQSAELIAKVARIVHYAHEHGMLHRDIKPGNILLDQKGEPHLTDFGLARLVETESTVTRTMEVMGTPSYMAPEQAGGNNAAASRATDVYGLGAVLYQLLSGHPPFAGGTTYETIRLVLETEPRPPRHWNRKIDRDLSTICLKCLEKTPQRRYASALALAEDLERWLKHEPIQARHTGSLTRARKLVRRNPTSSVLAAALVILSCALGWNLWQNAQPLASAGIAVLPFENLNERKEDAAFVDGIQDDVLTKLAKIADLKVISRTSVTDYRGKHNVPEIGLALRVSHVLEGSVRRSGTRLHINAQLVDTRTDTHLWAEQYDRDVNDLFAIQSEIAETIAEKLHAKISATEKLAIERKPTGDLVAFDLYSRAKDILAERNHSVAEPVQAIELLNGAVARDPSFFEAYCQLASAHDMIYFAGVDQTPARLALAQQAIDAAFRLKPDSGEAHLARAVHLYRGYRDYDRALAELEGARQSLPNDAQIFRIIGFIQRRHGKWEESRRSLERAAELDPRDTETLVILSWTHERFGRTAAAKTWLTRAVAVAEPDDASMKLAFPERELEMNGDPRPLHQAIESVRATNPAGWREIVHSRLGCALAERDAAAAREALSAMRDNEIGLGDQVQFSRAFVEGVIARMESDERRAQLAFAAARAEQEKVIEAQPEFGPAWCVLGMIDGALGRKEEALREGRHAIELFPVEKDALVGRYMVRYFAMIAAWVGEKDLACQQLSTLVGPPTFLSYGRLKLLPFWDPLRGDPRFEKIVASLASKERL
ncbi:MAG TPA: protein kinase [Chthoniobacterales bacterium]|nr:protein kinase [Chthoniobacterales bacterium]